MANETKRTDWKKIFFENRYPLWEIVLILVLYVIAFLAVVRFISGKWF
jgi:hypothetical protein